MVRAVFPVPGQANQTYFFHGTKYAKVKYTASTSADEVIYGSTEIVKEWKTLAKAGFSTVDAVLPTPGHADEVYFFSGTRYVRIVAGPHPIADYWQSLAKAGFDTLDAVLPVAGHEGQAYFFSDSQHAKIKYKTRKVNDVVTYGPKKSTDHWATLNKAGFDTLDAVLSVAGHEGQAYFSSSIQYVKVESVLSTSTEKTLYGPARVHGVRKSLAWGW